MVRDSGLLFLGDPAYDCSVMKRL